MGVETSLEGIVKAGFGAINTRIDGIEATSKKAAANASFLYSDDVRRLSPGRDTPTYSIMKAEYETDEEETADEPEEYALTG